MSTIKIQTTQNVTVEYGLASLGDRIIAQLIDWAVYFGWFILVYAVLRYLENSLLNLLGFLPVLFYPLLCEIFLNGQTLGKRARDIKVIKLNGQPPSVGDYLLRWLFCIIDILVFSGLVATVAVAASSRGQRLGDQAAGTTVIQTRPVQRRRFFDIRMEENYEVQFPAVANLTDKDLALIRKLLYKALVHRNPVLLEKTAERVRTVLELAPDMPDEEFLRTVIKDYHHLMQEVAV